MLDMLEPYADDTDWDIAMFELIRSMPRANKLRSSLLALLLLAGAVSVAGCGSLRRGPEPTPTRPPLATYTPTPQGFIPPNAVVVEQAAPAPVVQEVAAPVEVPTAIPAEIPTEAPTVAPTATPEPTQTPTSLPTATPTATPTPDYLFELEENSRFPLVKDDKLAGVRIFAYIYDVDEFALGNYGLIITRNDQPVEPVETNSRSAAGLPGQTRTEIGPYSRFTNLTLTVEGATEGVWTIQAVDANRAPLGRPAIFILGSQDNERELYVRYRRK